MPWGNDFERIGQDEMRKMTLDENELIAAILADDKVAVLHLLGWSRTLSVNSTNHWAPPYKVYPHIKHIFLSTESAYRRAMLEYNKEPERYTERKQVKEEGNGIT